VTGKSGASVLLLTFARRGEEQAIRDALAHMRSEIPDADVFAVGTPVSAPLLQEAGVESVIIYGAGRGARAVVRESRSRRPKAAAIIYWEPRLAGHLKLEALALLAGARVTHRFPPGSDARPVGRLGLMSSVASKSAKSLLCAAAGAALCGIAFACLLVSQTLAGGSRARRS
jgi:hypothetical protein